MQLFPVRRTKTKQAAVDNKTWIRGGNKLVSNTQIRKDELSVFTDITLVEDGKVQCPRDGQAYYGSESGTRVVGIKPFYKSNGTNQLIRMSGTTLQKYNAGSWSNISGKAYTSNVNAEMVTGYDNLYIVNGSDALTKYDGSSISTFTAILSPNAPTVTRTGTTGSYVFSYKITAVTAVGETAPSAAGTSDLNTNTLDTTNYMSVSWATVTSAIGYNVYGRKGSRWYFLKYLDGNGSTSYVDKGQDTPEESFTPPEGNTTGGPTGKYIELYKDSLFIAGDPSNPSRVYYSAGGDLISDFTVGNGGGFIDISKNDGQVVTYLKIFRNVLLIFKEDSVYQFSFTTEGLPSVTQVSSSVGAIAPRSVVAVENDIFFASRRGIFTIGNESGFGFDVLRTNELSARVRPVFQTIATAYLDNIAAVYATKGNYNLVIFAYTPTGSTTNSKALVYDRERLGWYEWTNINANCWTQYIDSSGETHVLYGDDSSGYVKEILTGDDDFGSPILGEFQLKAEDFDMPSIYKTLKDIDIIVRNPTGTINLSIIIDGVTTAATVPLTTVSPSVNWGHYVLSEFLFGESTGSAVSAQDENVLKTIKNANINGRSFMLKFANSSSGSFTLLYTKKLAKLRSERYRESDDIVQL